MGLYLGLGVPLKRGSGYTVIYRACENTAARRARRCRAAMASGF